jgi:hypothetical protein
MQTQDEICKRLKARLQITKLALIKCVVSRSGLTIAACDRPGGGVPSRDGHRDVGDIERDAFAQADKTPACGSYSKNDAPGFRW